MISSKSAASICLVFSLGSLKETVRILTSNDSDIVQNRSYLVPMALIFLSAMIYLTIRFWNKHKKETRKL